jgi:hypothetical protein
MANTRKHQLWALCIVLFLALLPNLSNAALFALGQDSGSQDGDEPVSLYTIDPSTGTSTFIGSTGLAIRGLAANPLTGRLYAIGSKRGPDGLYEINKSTGAATYIGGTFDGSSMSFGLDGTLYVIQPHDPGHEIYTLNLTTGADTYFAEISHNDYGGMAVTADGSQIIYIGDNGVESVNIATRIDTPITSWYDSLDGYPGRIAYAADGTLYGVSIPDYAGSLYTIDINAESVSSIGETGIHIYGLTFDDLAPARSVPSISTYGLIVVFLGLLLVASRYFRKSSSQT